MISAIEYIATGADGIERSISADRIVSERDRWHIKGSPEGLGLPPLDAIGTDSYGLFGSTYGGLDVSAREVSVDLYADGLNPVTLQEMLDDASRCAGMSAHGQLGMLRVRNSAGRMLRTPARCVQFDATQYRRRTAEVSASFWCPDSVLEDDAPTTVPFFAVTGGKIYPLTRPYRYSNQVQGGSVQTVQLYNSGDLPAPVTVEVYGAGMTHVEMSNVTTGTTLILDSPTTSGVGGMIVSTDPHRMSARFQDGTDASRYVSMFSRMADFQLVPGANSIMVSMSASSVTVAGTQISFRGRWSACL